MKNKDKAQDKAQEKARDKDVKVKGSNDAVLKRIAGALEELVRLEKIKMKNAGLI